MTARHACMIVPLCVLAAASGTARAEALPKSITVRVYETAGIDSHLKAAALQLAGATLASASAVVSWKQCDTGLATCDTPPADELVIRIVRATSEYPDRELPLGDALVDSSAGAAVLATVYFDRVDRVARAARMETATLLGYAVAHEIAHLLLASSAHSPRGLMRSIWRHDELRNRRAVDWRFTDLEVAAIQSVFELRRRSHPSQR
jgi:hypothetical protein